MKTDLPSNSIKTGLVYTSAATLCLLAPFVVFLTANNYSVLASDVLPLHAVGLAVGIGVGIIAILRRLTIARMLLWMCIVVAIAFLYDLDAILPVAIVAVSSGIVVCLLRDHAATVLLFAAMTHIASTISLHNIGRTPASARHVEGHGAAADAVASLPPVVHLLMDEFAGLRGLPSDIPGGPELIARMANYYPKLGFDLYSHAYSQYFYTTDSLANLLNFASSKVQNNFVSGGNDEFVMEVNNYFQHLSSLGYTLKIYQSSYMDFCNTPGMTVPSCSTYPSNSIESIAHVDLPRGQKTRFVLNSFLDSSAFLRKVRQVYYLIGKKSGITLPSWPTGNSRTGPLAVTPTLHELMKSLRKLRPGEVHFAHLHLAHYPYILDANCVIKPEVHTWLNRAPFEVEGPQGEQNTTASRADRYSQYFAQFECTQSIIEQLFSAIKSGGAWEQSIIIVHGDHGSRIVRHRPLEANLGTLVDDDFRDAFATFFAIKDSNSIGEIDTNTLPIQQLLARAWQLPPPVLVPNLVYVQSLNGALLPTTLKGFDSMPDIRANLKDR